jgi:hypothetical protein
MGLRPELHPFTNERGKTYLPAACHTMFNEDNVSRCVKFKARTIVVLKGHDNHIRMQQLLLIALHGSFSKKIVKPLIELFAFFKGICSKTLMEEDQARHEAEILIILCKHEQIFLPSFFTSMFHVVIHLVRECRLGGPVHYQLLDTSIPSPNLSYNLTT